MNAEIRRRWRGERSAITIATLLVVVAVLSLGVAQACLPRLAFAKSLAQDIQVQLTVEMLPGGQVRITVDAGTAAAGYQYVVLRDTESKGGYFAGQPQAVGPHAHPIYQDKLDKEGRHQFTFDMSAELAGIYYFQAIVFTEPPLLSNGVKLAPGPAEEVPPTYTSTPTSKPPTVPVTKAPPTATPTVTRAPGEPDIGAERPEEGFPWWGWLVPFLGGVGGVVLILRAIKEWQAQPPKEELTQEQLGKLIQIEKELSKEVPEKGYPELDNLIQIEELPEEEEEKADLPLDVLLHLKWVSNPQAKKKKLQWITWIGDIIDETPDPKPNFPASNLRLEFEIRDRFKDPKLAGLDLKTIKLTADFPFHELKPGTNLYDRKFIKRRDEPPHKHKFLNMESDNENLVKGWFMLDEPLKPGKHTITLAATDNAGNRKRISLIFTTTGLDLALILEWPEKKEPAVKKKVQVSEWRDGNIGKIPKTLPTFPGSGHQLNFLIKEKAVPPDSAKLDRTSIKLTANFPYCGFDPDTNLLDPKFRERLKPYLKITHESDQLVKGWLEIDEALKSKKHKFTLTGADESGNKGKIDLLFTTAEPELLLHLHGYHKEQRVEWKDEKKPIKEPDEAKDRLPTFPPQGLKLTFRVKLPPGLPKLERKSIRLTGDFPPEVSAILKKSVFFKLPREDRKIEGFIRIDTPLKDGEHKFALFHTDSFGRIKKIELVFTTAALKLALVGEGDKTTEGYKILKSVRAIHKRYVTAKAESYYEDVGWPPRWLGKYGFRAHVVDATGRPPKLELKCLGPNGEPLWAPKKKFELKDWPGHANTYRSQPFVVYDNNPAIRLSKKPKDWAIPAIPGSKITATLYRDGKVIETLEHPVPVRIPRLEITHAKIRATVSYGMPVLQVDLRLVPMDFTAEEKPPSKLSLIVKGRSGALKDREDGKIERIATVKNIPKGKNAKELQVSFRLSSYRNRFKSKDQHTFELWAAQPRAPLQIPPTVIQNQPVWFDNVEVDVLRNVQQAGRTFKPVNPYANIPEDKKRRIRRLRRMRKEGLDWKVWEQERPRGYYVEFTPNIGDRYAVRMRGTITDKDPEKERVVSEKTTEHPRGKDRKGFISLGGDPPRYMFEWVPKDVSLVKQWNALRLTMGIGGKLETLQYSHDGRMATKVINGMYIYQVEHKIKLYPKIEGFEYSRVTIIRGEQREQVKDFERKVRVLWGDKVDVELRALANDVQGHEYPAVKDLPLIVALDTPKGSEGYGFIVEGKTTNKLRIETKTNEEGCVRVQFQVPDIEEDQPPPEVQRFTLTVQPEKGDKGEFLFLVGKPTIEVTGPRFVIVNSQPTYRVRTGAKSDAKVTWTLYAHGQEKPIDQGEFKPVDDEKGHPIRPRFKTEADTIDYFHQRALCHQLVVKHLDDEVTYPVHVAEIDLLVDWDEAKLDSSMTCFARTAPYRLSGKFKWYWHPPKREMSGIPETRYEDNRSKVELPRIGFPGKHKVKVEFRADKEDEVCGGEVSKEFKIKPMRIEGPHILAPDEKGTFEVIPTSLDNVEWFVYTWEEKKDARKRRSGVGTTWEWKSKKPGGYTLKARWDRWRGSDGQLYDNEPSHDVVVGAIIGDDEIPPNGYRDDYHTGPRLVSGYEPSWKVYYYDEADNQTSSDILISGENDKVTVHDDGGSAYCWLEADFGRFEGMAENVVFRKRIALGEWLGRRPCQWRWNE